MFQKQYFELSEMGGGGHKQLLGGGTAPVAPVATALGGRRAARNLEKEIKAGAKQF